MQEEKNGERRLSFFFDKKSRRTIVRLPLFLKISYLAETFFATTTPAREMIAITTRSVATSPVPGLGVGVGSGTTGALYACRSLRSFLQKEPS